MYEFQHSTLWRSGFETPVPEAFRECRDHLKNEFLHFRSRAKVLVEQIPQDIQGLTVHDISHLDALWETASLVAGASYTLNPAETFVLGGAILLHDAGMSLAAYPNGLEDLSKTTEWKDIVCAMWHRREVDTPSQEQLQNPPPEIKNEAVSEALRLLHAKHADRLARLAWKSPSDSAPEYLIEDSELREFYGPIIGKIANSHWWSVSDWKCGSPRR